MGDISDNFSRHEFACHCGCGFDTVDIDLIRLCEFVRKLNHNKPTTVSSGCRCNGHNATIIGAAENSCHVVGRAADLFVDNPERIYLSLCKVFPNKYGFGLYDNRIHVDSRSDGYGRWDKRSKT